MRRRWGVWLLGIGWLAALGAGEWKLLRYEFTAGAQATSLPDWPSSSSLCQTPGVFNLLVFAHPRCPCTRATIRELAMVMAQCSDRLATQVLFFEPDQASAGWADTDLWHTAAAIPGVTIARDPAGLHAQCFGVRTSGQVLLYDGHGRLRFRGGITLSRGHEGASFGTQAIYDIVFADIHEFVESPVFGCSLFDPSPQSQRERPSYPEGSHE